MLIGPGIRELELPPNLPSHLAISNIAGLALA